MQATTCKILQSSNHFLKKQSYFEKITQNFMLFSVLVVLVFSVISTIVILARVQDLDIVKEFEPDADNGRKFFSYLILYSPLLPIAVYGTIDIILLFQRYNLESAFSAKRKSSSNSNVQDDMDKDQLKVLNPNTFPNLGQVSYCLLDKTGTLTTGDFKIKSVITQQKYYEFAENGIPEKLNTIGINTDSLHKEPTLTSPINAKGEQEKLLPTENAQEIYGHNPESLDISVDIDLEVNPEGGRNDLISPDKASYKFKEGLELKPEAQPNKGMTDQVVTEGVIPAVKKESASKTNNTGSLDIGKNDSKKKRLGLDLGKENSLKEGETFFAPTILQSAYQTDDFVKDSNGSNSQAIQDLAKCISICHSSRSRSIGTTEYKYLSTHPQETALLHFAKNVGYMFKFSNSADNPSLYTVKQGGRDVAYNILGVNEFTHSRMRHSVCFREPGSSSNSTATLVVKGPDSSMRERLELEEADMDIFNKAVAKNNAAGLRTVVIAKRIMDSTEASEYQKAYKNYKTGLYVQEEALEQIANEKESKLTLVGIVGLEDTIAPGAKEAVDSMRDAGIKCWMLTGDNMDHALNAGHAFDFIKQKKDVHIINASKHDDVRAQIRSVLTKMKRSLDDIKEDFAVSTNNRRSTISIEKTALVQESKNVLEATVLISGEAWEVLRKDRHLKYNFAFICAIAGNLVGFSFAPRQKRGVVQMIKRCFIGSPITLSIGDGLNDALMMQTSDISIEIANPNNPLKHATNAGDIRVQSFKCLKEILFIHGRNYSHKIEYSIIYLFYKSFLLGFPLFFFNWYNSFTGTTQFESMLVFLYSFLFTFFPVVFYAAARPTDSSLVLQTYPALYTDGKLHKKNIFKVFIVKGIFEALIQSALIFYFASYTLQNSVSDTGLDSSQEMMMLILFYSITVVSNIVVNRNCKHCTNNMSMIDNVVLQEKQEVDGNYSDDHLAVHLADLYFH